MEAEFGGGVDVLVGVIAEVKGFGRGDASLSQSFVEDSVESRSRFGDAMPVGKETKVLRETQFFEIPVQEGREKEGGVELGIGDNAEGQAPAAQSGQGFGGSWHGPDLVGDALAGKGCMFEFRSTRHVQQFAPEITDFNFGVSDAPVAGGCVFPADKVVESIGERTVSGRGRDSVFFEDGLEGIFAG